MNARNESSVRRGSGWLSGLLGGVLAVAAANVAAEGYLASFGPPGMSWPPGSGAVEAVYDVRHVWMSLLLLSALLGTLVVSVPALLAAVVRRTAVPLWALVPGLLVAALLASDWAAAGVRRRGLAGAATRMAPLVAAIEWYERERGVPPDSLGALVPAYLPDVSRFGLRGCRTLEYERRDGRALRGWWLGMDCPNGWLTLDRFAYEPEGTQTPPRPRERFGAWIYVWD